MRTYSFLASAEAAFIAGLSDRQISRIVDEELVPAALLEQHGATRRIAPLAAAFARFYFDTDQTLVAAARRDILDELWARVLRSSERPDVFVLMMLPAEMDWKVKRGAVTIDLSAYIAESFARARKVDDAEAWVRAAPEVMGGMPCFVGTRVPIEIVLASLDEGMSLDEVRESYPFLTAEHVSAARVYAAVHPRRGRPRRVSESSTRKRLLERKVVRPGKA